MATQEKSNEKRRVLIFDNESFIVKSLILTLKLYGWEVKFVSDIDELFYELNIDQHHYDILILDIMAPVPNNCKHIHFEESEIDDMNGGLMTGVVLSKKTWALERYKDTPILFLSGRTNPIPSDSVLQERHNLKICDYLRKPQLTRDIDKKLREMLNL